MRHVQLVPLNANVEKTNFGMLLLMRFNAEVSFYLGEKGSISQADQEMLLTLVKCYFRL